MTRFEHSPRTVPTGFRKVLYLNWPVILLLIATSSVGFLMLYSVAGGSFEPWAMAQMQRFAVGMAGLFIVAFVPIWFWRNMAGLAYLVSLALLIFVEVFGHTGMGAQRWINLGFIMLQPSELMKIALVMTLAAYYDWLDVKKVSYPLWVLVPLFLILLPTALVLNQPDLGTSIMLVGGGAVVMFAAGVSWIYFSAVIGAGVGLVVAVFQSRGTSWQLLKDYQYRRIDTFLDPSSNSLGAGYHITQAKIALGSGGWSGRGFMGGTQSRLNFLPEKHTDFIFTTLAEEFGFIGGVSLLVLYALIIFFSMTSGLANKDRFSALLTVGITGTFFIYIAVNMSMVMGLVPVVGAPLPLVSYGGSAMMVLLLAFGLMQSAHVHRPR